MLPHYNWESSAIPITVNRAMDSEMPKMTSLHRLHFFMRYAVSTELAMPKVIPTSVLILVFAEDIPSFDMELDPITCERALQMRMIHVRRQSTSPKHSSKLASFDAALRAFHPRWLGQFGLGIWGVVRRLQAWRSRGFVGGGNGSRLQ